MPIPTGTKFHGVAPEVDTTDRGSESVAALRDVYTIEDIADAVHDSVVTLTPIFVTASAGSSVTMTEMVNIVDFTWDGANGVFEYILPSATEIPYRKIRFVNDGTIGSATRVDLTAPAGETIDGAATYQISRAYNGCAVWSDGTEWIVIQAKG